MLLAASPFLSFALIVAVHCIIRQVAKWPWRTPTRDSILRLLGIRLGYLRTIVVGDGAVAVDALVHHADAFSDRPAGSVATAIISDGRMHVINSVPHGPHWSALRRNLNSEVLHPVRGLARAAPHRRRAFAALVADIAARSESGGTVVPVRDCLYPALFALNVTMCFGDGVDDEQVNAMRTLQREFIPSFPGLSVFATFQKVAKLVYRDRWKRLIRARRRQEQLYLPLIKACQERRRGRGNDGGEAVTSYVDSLLDLEIPAEVDPKGKGTHRGRRRRKLSEGEMVGLVSEYLGAATETVLAAMEWTLANLVRRPDIQSRLRGEVEAGGGEACAYLRAVVMESLRRHPTVPFVLRHISSDALLGSTSVTQGSMVNFVVSKIGRDKKTWTSPDEFSPDRFMPGGEGAGVRLNRSGGGKEAKTMMMMPFGAGRRICPGMGYAILHLEYFLANLVTAFEWHQVEGEVVDLKEKRGFFTTMQNPLRARVVPRTAPTV